MRRTSNKLNSKAAAAAAAQHVECVVATQAAGKELREQVATNTLTAIRAILAAAATDTRAAFLTVALDAYKSLPAWPSNEKGEKKGEKAAGTAGKAYVALRVMTYDRFNDDMTERTAEELAKYRSERSKEANEKAKAEGAKEIQDAMAKAGVVPLANMTAEQAFSVFVSWFDTIGEAKQAFRDMADAEAAARKAKTETAAVKLVGQRAAAEAAARQIETAAAKERQAAAAAAAKERKAAAKAALKAAAAADKKTARKRAADEAAKAAIEANTEAILKQVEAAQAADAAQVFEQQVEAAREYLKGFDAA